MNILLDIGLQCVKKVHHDFDPIIDKKVEVPHGIVSLTFFSDIFFIVFDNIRRHSGTDSNPHVFVQAREELGHLHIVIRSEVSRSNLLHNQRRVEGIKQSFVDGRYEGAVRSEGGTGLTKLWNILSLSREHDVDFGFDPDGWFFVELHLTLTELPTYENPDR